MSDLVERLRKEHDAICSEAAERIEELERERDEALERVQALENQWKRAFEGRGSRQG